VSACQAVLSCAFRDPDTRLGLYGRRSFSTVLSPINLGRPGRPLYKELKNWLYIQIIYLPVYLYVYLLFICLSRVQKTTFKSQRHWGHSSTHQYPLTHSPLGPFQHPPIPPDTQSTGAIPAPTNTLLIHPSVAFSMNSVLLYNQVVCYVCCSCSQNLDNLL